MNRRLAGTGRIVIVKGKVLMTLTTFIAEYIPDGLHPA